MTTHRIPRGHDIHPRIHYRPDITSCDVIGDVHGCYDELAELLTKLGHEPLLDPEVAPAPPGQAPVIVFVGDIVDRGDRILDSLRLVYRLCQRGHALTVVGNHDDRFLRWLTGRRAEVRHGLQETIDEFQALPEQDQEVLREDLSEFLGNLPWAIQIGHQRAVVAHAAWHGGLYESTSDKIRSYALYGPTTGQKTPEGFPERIDWAPHYTGPELVIFGHQVYATPYFQPHAIGIDTGCVFGGSLTALRYPSLEVVSVKSRRARG